MYIRNGLNWRRKERRKKSIFFAIQIFSNNVAKFQWGEGEVREEAKETVYSER